MTRISILSGHPVTIIAAGPVRYHFCQLIDVTKNLIRLQLRRAVRDAQTINIQGVILETLGGVTVEIDCRNITSIRGSQLTLEILEPALLEIRITAPGGDYYAQ
jgi:uncharacterized membrane protein YcaP (DUF421 family)